jgi:lipoprotein
MNRYRLNNLICYFIIVLVLFSGCKSNHSSNSLDTTKPIVSDSIPIKTDSIEPTDSYINEPEMSRIEFGLCETNKLNYGAKYYFDEKKLEWSNDFENDEIIIEQIDDETAKKFKEALKKANLISWKDSYFNIEDNNIMYDGQWIISVYYKDGSTKEIAGFGIIPKKGHLFEEAISMIWAGWDWL